MRARREPDQDELRQMVRCVQLYYRAQRHQNEIARELGMSSSKVSRLLKRALAEGMVRVEIDLPKRPRLEAALVERFRLRDAVVIPLGEPRHLKEDLGTAAARYFEKVAADGARVGLSCGSTEYGKLVVAVAGGPDKRAAILGAMRGRFANVLVTDEDTAAALLTDGG